MIKSLFDPSLAFHADMLDDLERTRIAQENRLRQLTRTEPDKDGEERGFGLSKEHPEVLVLAEMVTQLKILEEQAVKSLQKKLKANPLHAWIKTQRGLGDKQVARLLAAIGDPYINVQKDAARGLYSLWAYCGFHVLLVGHIDDDTQSGTAGELKVASTSYFDPKEPGSGVAPRRKRGQRANWSMKAKMRAYLIAESCIKQRDAECKEGHIEDCRCSPYRIVYDNRRTHTAVTHPEWTDGHSHNDAMRIAAKEILRGLWTAAREWHIKNDPETETVLTGAGAERAAEILVRRGKAVVKEEEPTPLVHAMQPPVIVEVAKPTAGKKYAVEA
jgi:hypothetical protein